MKKFIKTLAVTFIVLSLAATIGLHFLIKPIADLILSKAGLTNITFESAHVGFDSVTFKNVQVSGDAVVRMGTFVLTWHKKVLVKDMSVSVGDNGIVSTNAVLQLDKLYPLSFQHQEVAVGALNAGLPLTNGTLDISMDEAEQITVHKSTWRLAGGTVASSPFTISRKNISADINLSARNIDLEQLFRLVSMEGLDATGIVNGDIPLKIRKGDISIVNGILETKGGGAIRYNPKEVPLFLQDTTKSQILDLRVALTAFEYDSLKITLNGEAGKSQKILLQAKGRNPGFYEGHSVNLNFNVEGPLQSVIQSTPGGSSIPDDIRGKIETFERDHGAK